MCQCHNVYDVGIAFLFDAILLPVKAETGTDAFLLRLLSFLKTLQNWK